MTLRRFSSIDFAFARCGVSNPSLIDVRGDRVMISGVPGHLHSFGVGRLDTVDILSVEKGGNT